MISILIFNLLIHMFKFKNIIILIYLFKYNFICLD